MDDRKRFEIGMDLLRSLHRSKQRSEPVPNLVPYVEPRRAQEFGEKQLNYGRHRFGKILMPGGWATDWVGELPQNMFNQDPFAWRNGGQIPIEQYSYQYKNGTLVDDEGLFDPPITFMAQYNGRPYGFNLSSHYNIREATLADLHGQGDQAHMFRAALFYEAIGIGGKQGDPYPHTGYDVFDLIKHPGFWVQKHDDVTEKVVNPRFPVRTQKEDQGYQKASGIAKETWGFPVTHPDAQRYFPLVAKIIGHFHNKPYDYDATLGIINGFEDDSSNYRNATKKLDLVRFLHDLRGKWLYFGTSPNVGYNNSLLGINFPDKIYFEKGKYTGNKPFIPIDPDRIDLSPQEKRVGDLLETQLGVAQPTGKPSETYTLLQTEISTILNSN